MTKQLPPKEDLEYKYDVEKKTIQAIGEEYGVSTPTAKKWLTRFGISIHSTNGRHSLPIPPKQDLVELYVEQDLATKKIGEKYGVCMATVLKWIKGYGIDARDHRYLPRPPKEELVELYDVQHLTAKKIGDIYGCSGHTVTSWLACYGISAHRPRPTHRGDATCQILREHAEDMKDDPERLSTEFMQRMIGVRC